MSQKHIIKMPGKKEPAKLSATLNNLLVIRLVIACVIFAVSLIIDIPDFLTTVFLAGSVDYSELKTHHRDESVVFSMQTFVVKAASGLAVFICGIGLDLIGLAGDTAETGEIVSQSASTLLGLRLMMNLLPILGLLCAFLFFRKRFKLTDSRMEEIIRQLGRSRS